LYKTNKKKDAKEMLRHVKKRFSKKAILKKTKERKKKYGGYGIDLGFTQAGFKM
jgi:hypothetical protein